MKKMIVASVVAAALLMGGFSAVWAWGVWGHTHINKGAVLALPKEMGMFFYNHTDFITEESIVPDLRKYTMGDKAEGPRHYVDLEKYNYETPAKMPLTLEAAQAKFGKDTLARYGMLPWYIQEMMEKLTDAFRKKRKGEILLLAGDLGHYIADAHMPLHTTLNHNGQLTGQEGIHAFWESQLPEIFGKNYSLNTGEAVYIEDIRQATWLIIDSSYRLAPVLLKIENKLRRDNPEEKRYQKGTNGQPARNKFGQPVHSYEYAHVYHELLDGMVEKQMRAALRQTANFWYTAWVNAGRPDLTDLDPDYITERNKAFYRQDIKAWERGKVRGCKSDKEFETVEKK